MAANSPDVKQTILADTVFPAVGGSQFQTIVWNSKSEVPFDPNLFLHVRDLPRTVLASAFYDNLLTIVPTGLPEPYHQLTLPTIPRKELRETKVYNAANQCLGILLSVPALAVHANQILLNLQRENQNYNYLLAVSSMMREAARLMASVLRRTILRPRQKPGLMAHIIDSSSVATDEVAIPFAFARELFHQLRKSHPQLEYSSPWNLDGLPCYTIRFPLANEWGVQVKILRIIEGKGRAIYLNPWVLEKRYLGDSDGDLGFILPMVEDILAGKVFQESRPRLTVNNHVEDVESQLTLDGILNPSLLDLTEKELGRMTMPVLHTLEDRLATIADAQTVTLTGTATTMTWHMARVLATANPKVTGISGAQEAYRKAYNVFEFLIEGIMDARKGDSAFSRGGFDIMSFMETLVSGGVLPLDGLRAAGMKEEAIETLNTCWQISSGNLSRYCQRSPIYRALVVQRRTMETSVLDMLTALYRLGIKPEDVYGTVIADMDCSAPLLENNGGSR
jgi:hypothetical protein